MKTLFARLTRLGLLIATLPAVLPPIPAAHAADVVRVLTIRGTINPAASDYLRTQVKEAETARAQALIVELDTPGGLVSSVQAMSQTIDESGVPVIVYVTPAGAAATSAGALLMLASHVGAMTPGSHMGAAHPVDSSGKDIEGAMGQKALNDTVAFAQSLAEVRGRNRELAGLVVSKSLSFTAREAVEKGLAEIEATELESLLSALHGREVKVRGAAQAKETKKIVTVGARVERVEMSWGQSLLHWLSNPNIAAILMTLAMLLIYMELKSPGIQIGGILGVILLIVAFMCLATLPIRVGAAILLAVGVLAMVSEVVVAAHGALALGGVVSFILGLIWIVDPSQSASKVLPAVWIPAAAALGSGTLAIGYFAARAKRDAEAALAAMGGGGAAGLQGYVAQVIELAGGAEASPMGKVMIRGELWDFTSEDSVRVGDRIEVVDVKGLKILARKAGAAPESSR